MMQLQQEKEIFMVWTQLSSNNGFVAANQLICKHIRDQALKKILNDFTDCLKEETKLLEKRLKGNGISLTPSYIKQLETQNELMSFKNVTETEMSAVLSMNIASSLVATSKGLEEATSEYTLLMYGHFHMKKSILGARLLQLSKEKGWLGVSTK